MPQVDIKINGGKKSVQARQAALIAQVLGCSWEMLDSPVTQGDWTTPLAVIEQCTLENNKIISFQIHGVRELVHALLGQNDANGKPIMTPPGDNSELCRWQLALEIQSIFDRHAEPILSEIMNNGWAFSITLPLGVLILHLAASSLIHQATAPDHLKKKNAMLNAILEMYNVILGDSNDPLYLAGKVGMVH